MSSQAVIPRRSSRLTTFIPASHWISIGYSQDDAQLMERLQNDIKKYCDGNHETAVELNGRRGDITPYHDMLLSHWQKLFKALKRRTNVETFMVLGIYLPTAVSDIMFPVLQSINLKHLMLLDARLGTDGLLRLSSFIKDNRRLFQLVIGSDTINDMLVARSLSDAVKDHPNLKSLGIVQCGLNNANILGKVLEGCSGLNELRLGYEKLGLESITIMADFIRSSHPRLEKISMIHCSITDAEMVILAAALKNNTNLKDLGLSDNDITEEGDILNKNLLAALYDPTSMDSIVECNHICKVYIYDADNSMLLAMRPHREIAMNNINGDDDISIQQKIRKKVVLALCGVYGDELFDLSHLNDLPLQLMPRALELIQEHTDRRTKSIRFLGQYGPGPIQLEKEALSRLFHTLRGWELPLLFENLGSTSAKGVGKKRKRRKIRR